MAPNILNSITGVALEKDDISNALAGATGMTPASFAETNKPGKNHAVPKRFEIDSYSVTIERIKSNFISTCTVHNPGPYG